MNSTEFHKSLERMDKDFYFLGKDTLAQIREPLDLEEITIVLRLPKVLSRIPETMPSEVTLADLIEEAMLGILLKDKAMFIACMTAYRQKFPNPDKKENPNG